jgi:hypothetical protein
MTADARVETARPPGAPFQRSLYAIGVRCVLRYLVLPFVLPLLAAAGPALRGVAFGVLVILDVVAVASIVATVRMLWRRRHPGRWWYLALASVLTVFAILMLVVDSRPLLGQP